MRYKNYLSVSILLLISFNIYSNTSKFDLEESIANNKAEVPTSLFENTDEYFKNNNKYKKTKNNKSENHTITVEWQANYIEQEVLDENFNYYNNKYNIELTDIAYDYQENIIDDNTNINISYNNNDDNNSNNNNWYEESVLYSEPEILSQRKKVTKFNKYDKFYGKHLCDTNEYSCIKLKKGDTWKSLFPNAETRELIQRLNRTNRGLWNRSWILVPNNISLDYLDYSPMPDYKDTNGEKTVVINTEELAFGAYNEDGDLVHWGPVNPGKSYTRTAKGDNFKVYRKGSSRCWSKKFQTEIPYCMFFYKGFAMHGYTMPGYPASHGCVRMYNSDAKWLNKEFTDYGTRVIVY